MSLPKLEKKWFTAKLPLSKSTVKFRPYTVGDQKQLMLIKETMTDNSESWKLYLGVINMIQSCTENLNVSELMSADVESLFFELKSASDGNEFIFDIPCQNKECNHLNRLTVNTKKDMALTNKVMTKKIRLPDSNIDINLKYPGIGTMIEIQKEMSIQKKQSVDVGFRSIISCIESIVEGEKIYKPKEDFTVPEALEFIDQLNDKIVGEIIDFFKAMPSYKYEKEFLCEKCNNKLDIADSGGILNSFL